MKKTKIAIVTGATSGIGFAVAKDLLKRGFQVYICGRSGPRLHKALDLLIQEFGIEVIDGSICDVRNLESVKNMVDLVIRKFGGIDVLINNAGIAYVKPFEEISPNDWKDILDTNLTGIYNCCHVTLPWLKKANGADIINLGSRSGRYSYAGGVGYNSTKFAVQGFSEALFLDLFKYGIRVSLVAPGTVATDLIKSKKEKWHLQPEDVAEVVGNLLESKRRATVNWVELRPSFPS